MPYAVLLLGVLALPWVASWSFLVNGYAWLTGDASVYAVGHGTEEWAHRMVFLTLFLVVAGFLWATDRWLAGIVAFAGMQTFLFGPRVVSAYLLIGAGAIVVMRRAPSALRARALVGAGWSAVAMALIVCAQRWKGVDGVGSFGVSGLAACYIGAAGLLAPGWTLPLIGVGVALTNSRAGILAFLIGLGVRYAPQSPVFITALIVLVALAMGYATWRGTTSADARRDVHALAVRDWRASASTLLIGFGLGAWSQRIPDLQKKERVGIDSFAGSDEIRTERYFQSAHNDALQWLYETGVIGSALLAGWMLRWRRRLLAPPLAPAFAVIAVMALAWFPFHDLRTSMLAAALVGLGTGESCPL